jgi:hypothetical protein
MAIRLDSPQPTKINVAVESTLNYDKFKFFKGNRPIQEKKIKSILKSVEGGINLFPYCPILVNKDYFVIDGQHRLESCKRLKSYVYYIVVPSFTLYQIAQINSVVTKWSYSDFTTAYIESGIEDYKQLMFFKDKYEMPYTLCIALLMLGSSNERDSSLTETFYRGEFKCNHYEKAKKILDLVYDYLDICIFYKDRNFVRAVELISRMSEYKHKGIITYLKSHEMVIIKESTSKGYMKQLMDINKKL